MSDMDEKLATRKQTGGRAMATLDEIKRMAGKLVILATDVKGKPVKVKRHVYSDGTDPGDTWARVPGGGSKDALFEKLD